MSKELEGRVAIITGASRGIGRAIAEALAEDGCNLVLCGRDKAALAETKKTAEAKGVKTAEFIGDLMDPTVPDQIAALAKKTFGKINIVIGNAGSTKGGDFVATTDADWADGFGVKFFAHVRLSKAVWPMLMESRGSWVTISGINARTPKARFTIGASVNQAYMAFTKSLADLGLRDGVQVNTINPGYVDTDRFSRMLQEIGRANNTDSAGARKLYVEKHGEVATAQEIADLVSFVVTKKGRYFHGAALDIDGGVTPGLV